MTFTTTHDVGTPLTLLVGREGEPANSCNAVMAAGPVSEYAVALIMLRIDGFPAFDHNMELIDATCYAVIPRLPDGLEVGTDVMCRWDNAVTYGRLMAGPMESQNASGFELAIQYNSRYGKAEMLCTRQEITPVAPGLAGTPYSVGSAAVYDGEQYQILRTANSQGYIRLQRGVDQRNVISVHVDDPALHICT